MVAAVSTSAEPSEAGVEERMLVPNVPWSTYVVLRDSLDIEGSKLRLTYCEGELELMSPSDDHEETKTAIGCLVEAYARAMKLPLWGRGSTTFRKEAARRGLEADEWYSVGRKGDVPDLAIEVVVSRAKLDKLEVYRGLGVPEVWVWRDGALRAYVLVGDRYEETVKSKTFPMLDLSLLASFVRLDQDQTTLVEAFVAALASARR